MPSLKAPPSSTAVANDIVRNADYYDLCIATVSVSAGITGITQAMITDTRMDSNVCGFVGSLIKPDTSGWFVQFESVFNNMLSGNQDDWDTWFAGANLAFNDAMVANQDDWDIWFATIQDALGGDTAGNLLSLINTKANEVHTHTAADVTSGALPIARGGTGATSASAARTALGAAQYLKLTGTIASSASWSGPNAQGYNTYAVTATGVLSTDNVDITRVLNMGDAAAALIQNRVEQHQRRRYLGEHADVLRQDAAIGRHTDCMEGGAVMGQAFCEDKAAAGPGCTRWATAQYLRTPEGLELVLPSGVTWGQIETMMIGGLNSEYLPNYYKKDPGEHLCTSTGGTTTPASSATALSALNLYNADIVIIVLK